MDLKDGQCVTLVTEDGEYHTARIVGTPLQKGPDLTGVMLAVSVQPYAKGEPGMPMPA